MKRSKHNLSFYRMVTADMGKLVPIGCVPVLPGDTFNHQASALVRVSPLNTPVMHPVSIRIHHFFVPNRILWDEWEDFITGGPNGTSTPTIPTINTINTDQSCTPYLYGGLELTDDIEVNALPMRAYNKIYNEFYRDQDLSTEILPDVRTMRNCSWEKDYFTTARPFTQKGPEVTLPVGTKADIVSDAPPGVGGVLSLLSSQSGDYERIATDLTFGTLDDAGLGQEANKLYADLAATSAININDFRAAFALQRYQEARARYGSRFTEYLRYLGIRPSDARLQRPEYLGGSTARLNFSEVLQTAPNDSSGGPEPSLGIGDLYGHGIAGVRGNTYRKFFEEHGYVITLMSARPKSIYLNGTPREFIKSSKEDYYQKELVNLGQQEVYQAELYSENTRDVFGYQDRYHEYRSHPSQISAEFQRTLSSWHLGRDLAPDVTLNGAFVQCNPSDRIYQVPDGENNKLWIMCNHKLVARRLVPARANPRIL